MRVIAPALTTVTQRKNPFIFLLLLGSTVTHAAAPKEVAKQTEGDWRDGRYSKMTFGSFVSGHIATPKGSTHKGIAIRVGEKGEGTMVFDTDLCTWRAGWIGGFSGGDGCATKNILLEHETLERRLAL